MPDKSSKTPESSDITLVVGVDVGASYTEFQKGISALVAKCNADPPKIKVDLDIDHNEIKKLKSELKSLDLSKNSVNTGSSRRSSSKRTTTGSSNSKSAKKDNVAENYRDATNAIKQYYKMQTALKKLDTDIRFDKRSQSYSSLSGEWNELSKALNRTSQAYQNVRKSMSSLPADKQASLTKVLTEEQEKYNIAVEKSTNAKQATQKKQAKRASDKAVSNDINQRYRDSSNAIKQYYKMQTALKNSDADIVFNKKTGTHVSLSGEWSELATALDRTKNAYQNVRKSMSSLPADKQASLTKLLTEEQEKYNTALEKSANIERANKKKQDSIQKEQKDNKEAADAIARSNLSKQYDQYISEVQSKLKNYSAAQYSGNKGSRGAYQKLFDTIETASNSKNSVMNNSIAVEELKKKLADLKAIYAESTKTIKENNDATKTFMGHMGSLGSKFVSWLSVSQIIMFAVNSMHSMVTASIELDTAMTELRKVTDETDATYDGFLDQAIERTTKLGASLTDVVNATADFSRLGYDLKSATLLADAATVYKNVGDDVADISQASQSIISTMQAFGMDNADEAMNIVDKFNEIGNKYAISSGGAGEALLRSAAAMKSAGNTLDETLALTAAANTVVQDPEKVGTTLKTISMFLRSAKTEAEEAGISTDGMAQSVSKLRNEFLALTGGRVDIQKDADTYKSTYEILKELSEVWDSLTDISKANILEKVGGKRNANVAAAFLENFSIAEKALETSANASGSAMAENEKYLDSIQGRLDTLKGSFQALSANIIQSGDLKFLVGIGNKFLNVSNSVAELIDKLGGLRTILLFIAGMKISSNAEKIGTVFGKIGEKFSKFIGIYEAFKEVRAGGGKGFSNETLQKAGFKGISSVGLAFGGVTIAITAFIAAMEAYNRKLEEQRKQTLDQAETAKTNASEILDLSSAYREASDAYSNNEGSKESLMSATDALLEKLGVEKGEIQDLVQEYGSLSGAINEVTKNTLKSDLSDMFAGLETQKEDIKKKNAGIALGFTWDSDLKYNTKDGFSKKDKVESLFSDKELKQLRVGKYQGYVTFDDIMDAYNRLVEYKERAEEAVYDGAITQSELSENSLYNAVVNKINALSSYVEDYGNSVDEINKTAAELYSRDLLDTSGIPKNEDQLNSFIDDVYKAGMANEQFVGSEADVKNAILDTLSSMSEMKDLFDSLPEDFTLSDSIPLDLDNFKKAFDSYEKAVKDYNDTVEKGGRLKSVFGNVDTNNRQAFEWTDENLSKYKKVLQMWNTEANDSWDEFSKKLSGTSGSAYGVAKNFEGLEIAFTPILQTEDGAVMLDSKTVDDYIYKLMRVTDEKLGINNPFSLKTSLFGSTDTAALEQLSDDFKNQMLQFDAQGIEINGRLIKGIIADIGDTAKSTAEIMQDMGNTGTLGKAVSDLKEASGISINSKDLDDFFYIKIGAYISKQEELNEALDKYQSGNFSNEDLEKLKSDFPAIADGADDLSAAIIKQKVQLTGYSGDIDSVSGSVENATGVMGVFANAFGKVDSDEDTAQIQALKDAVLEYGEVLSASELSFDIKTETEGVTNFATALKESVSAAGVSAESLANLRDRYSDLESKGYDVSSVFERTENGIHLNTTALRKLEHAYQESNKQEAQKRLQDLTNQYNYFTEQIDLASDAASTADLYAQRNDILTQIADTADLAAQYEGLTSAYYEWEQAQSGPEEGDMYDSVAKSLEDIKKLYDDGLVGTNKFRAAVQLMSNTDLSNADEDELIKSYQKGMSKMQRYFTEDSSDGALNFLNDLHKINAEWARMNKDGSWDINFGVGNDEEIAKALNINVESVQAIMRKLSDFGFEINIDSVFTDLEKIKSKADEANDKLKELGKTQTTFNFNTSDLDYVNKQVDEASKLLDQFRNENGTINLTVDGAEEAQTVFISLMSQKQALSTPAIMSVETKGFGEADKELGDWINKLQNFVKYSNTLEIQTQLGVDTSSTQQLLQDTANQLKKIPEEITTQLNIDKTGFDEAINNISNVKLSASVSLNQDDIAAINTTIASINPGKIKLSDNSSETLNALHTVDEYKISDKTFKVSANTKAWDTAKGKINSYSFAAKTIDVKYRVTTPAGLTTGSSTGSKSGSAKDKSGSSSAIGNPGIRKPGQTLVGELGQELVARDGEYFTVGDNGAEMVNLKKGDIVFDAEQTHQLLSGKIRDGKKRGLALSGGTGRLTKSGKTKTKTSSKAKNTKSSSQKDSNSKSSTSSGKDSEPEKIDWIEIAVSRIERVIDRFKTIADSTFQSIYKRLNATNSEISNIRKEINLQNQAYNRYIKEANSVGLSSILAKRVQDGTIDINQYDEDTQKKIQEYQQWYEKALSCSDAIQDLHQSIAELYTDKFDDIQSHYESQLSAMEHLSNTYDKSLDALETKGYFKSIQFYTALQDVEKQNIAVLQKQLSALTQAFTEAMNSGEIYEYSEAWFSMQQEMNSVKEALDDANVSLLNYQKTARETKWGYFDYLQEKISDITTESNFLIGLMENDKLFSDKGKITDEGRATMGLRAQNYNVYMAQADKYANEILDIDKELATNPYNQDLLNRRQELLEAQQDAISSAEDEKQAIVELVKEGIEKELESLKDLIDKYEESLDSAKDLYDFQKKVKDQAEDVAKLQKQLSAYEGDTSEEAKSKIQQIKVDLSKAQEDLAETEYDKYISDTKDLLDKFYEQYEDILNARLDDVDALIAKVIDMVNDNASSISSTIHSTVNDVGYTLSNSMDNIWSTAAGNITDVVSTYGDGFTGYLTTINGTLSSIAATVGAMVAAADEESNKKVTSTTTYIPANKPASSTTSSNKSNVSTNKQTTNNTSTSSSSAKTIKVGGKINAAGAKIYSYAGATKGSNQKYANDPIYTVVSEKNGYLLVRYHKLSSGYTGWFKKSDVKAYKTGGLVDYTGLAQLDGSPAHPELVLNASDTENFIKLRDMLRKVSESPIPLTAAATRNRAISNPLLESKDKLTTLDNYTSSRGDFNITFGDIKIDHVEDYNDFVTQLQRDSKFEKMVQSMTIDRLSGGSQLSKNKYRWTKQ